MYKQVQRRTKRPLSPLLLAMRKFKSNTSGATAIEFGMVALPFLALLFAILEVSLLFFGSLALDNALEQSARLVRTGQAQTGSMSAAEFKKNVCDQIVSLFNCTNKLQVELITFDDFQSASNYASDSKNAPLNDSGELKDSFAFKPDSEAGEIVLLRAYFEWDISLDIPGISLANMDNGNHLLTAVMTFKNEPFN